MSLRTKLYQMYRNIRVPIGFIALHYRFTNSKASEHVMMVIEQPAVCYISRRKELICFYISQWTKHLYCKRK